MTAIDNVGLVIGVDTHLDTHTAALCDSRGRPLAQLSVATTPAGYSEMLEWARDAAGHKQVVWAIEGTRHYGLGLSRFLLDENQRVAEIDATRHIGKRRRGKSDPIDAVRAAKELLARSEATEPRADGDREALRILMVDRGNAVEALRSSRTVLASLVVTAPAEIREELRDLSRRRRAQVCADLVCPDGSDRLTRVTHESLGRLGRRIVELSRAVAELETEITTIVEEMAPGLIDSEPGLGALSLAQILLSWSHAGRIRSEAAFAMLSGTAPVPVSSGRTDRYRLNRLGDRQLNRALHVVAVNRMRHDPPTRAYVERRRGEGRTDKEIRRCLKRYIARHLYRTLNQLDVT